MKEQSGNQSNRWETSKSLQEYRSLPPAGETYGTGDWIEAVAIENVPDWVRDLFRSNPGRDELELGLHFDDTRPGMVDLLLGPFEEMALPYDHVHHNADFPGVSPLCVLLKAIEDAVYRGDEPENPHLILFQRTGKALPCALRQGLTEPYDRQDYPGLALPREWEPPEEWQPEEACGPTEEGAGQEWVPVPAPQASSIKQFEERERTENSEPPPAEVAPAQAETDQPRISLADYHDSAPSSLVAGMNSEMAAFMINETMRFNEGGEMTLAVYFSQEKSDSLALDFQDDGEGLALQAYDCLPLGAETGQTVQTLTQLFTVIGKRVLKGEESDNPHFFTINLDALWIAPLSEDRNKAPLPEGLCPRRVH